MNNFAIALNAGTPEKRNKITNYLSKQDWPYWHWVDDFWIVQVPNSYTPKTLHSLIENETNIGKPTMLIFKFSGSIDFWGRNEKDAWEWLNHIGVPK